MAPPCRRTPVCASRPAQKRTLENEYNHVNQDEELLSHATRGAKKQRQFTTPYYDLERVEMNDTPSCSKTSFSSASGRSVVTQSKAGTNAVKWLCGKEAMLPLFFSNARISSPSGRSVVTERKAGNRERKDYEVYSKMKEEYRQQKEDGGLEQTPKERKSVFQLLVRQFVFNKIKFILKEADLDFGGPVYECMAGKLKLEEDKGVDIEQYWNWNVHRTLVRETLNNKRGTINGMMKEAFNST